MTIASITYNFDVSDIDPYVGGGGPLPTGVYAAMITAMEVKANNNQATGHNLALIYTVMEGELKGRKFFDNLNLWFKNPENAEKEAQTIEIANRQLSSIGHAVGVTAGADLALLGEKLMLVDLEEVPEQAEKVNPNTGEAVKGRKASNRIIRRDPYIAQSANSGAAPQFQQQQQAAAAASAPAFNPAQQAQQIQSPAAAQQAPAFQQASAPAAGGAPVNGAAPAASGPATPPWQRG